MQRSCVEISISLFGAVTEPSSDTCGDYNLVEEIIWAEQSAGQT